MREYELSVVYDLGVAEAGGQNAAVERLTALVQARGGELVKTDHWGRRRLAYPINGAIDGDYVITRVMLDPSTVGALEAAFRIDERVYRHLVVRADELPAPAPPREPRAPRRMAEPVSDVAAPEAAAPEAAAPEAPVPDAVAETAAAVEAPDAEIPAAEAMAAEEPAAAAAEPELEPEAAAQEPERQAE
jgi:small subunit ribosomal protein S6